MDKGTPLEKSKDSYSHIINAIKSDSAVGIDAQLTHAVIIEYLQNIDKRLSIIEKRLVDCNE